MEDDTSDLNDSGQMRIGVDRKQQQR